MNFLNQEFILVFLMEFAPLQQDYYERLLG